MATLVGTQSKFLEALKELVELDYDAIEAYEAAINRLENEFYKTQLQKFKKDHERHVKEINKILILKGEGPVTEPSSKQWLTQGKVVLANLVGDKAVLQAMYSNEEDTNTAYQRLNDHADKWPETVEILTQGLADEKSHKKWLEENK
jgi:rubrerythrin